MFIKSDHAIQIHYKQYVIQQSML